MLNDNVSNTIVYDKAAIANQQLAPQCTRTKAVSALLFDLSM